MRQVVTAIMMAILFTASPFLVKTSLPEEKENRFLPETISVYDAEKKTVESVSAEDYIAGVVFAEMPPSFHEEALKAQAVAARSYLARHLFLQYGRENHSGADICTDGSHCMAFRIEPENEEYQKIRSLVSETAGELLLFDDKPAECVFHSSSFLTTESALNLWSFDYPYLVSVLSPEKAAESTLTFSPEDFADFLGVKTSGDPGKWIEKTEKEANGRTKSLSVCGKTLSGNDFRFAFGLPSTFFKITFEENSFRIDCRGYGHGVGMSQYGADTLARMGFDYSEILSHYYPGTVLKKDAGE